MAKKKKCLKLKCYKRQQISEHIERPTENKYVCHVFCFNKPAANLVILVMQT